MLVIILDVHHFYGSQYHKICTFIQQTLCSFYSAMVYYDFKNSLEFETSHSVCVNHADLLVVSKFFIFSVNGLVIPSVVLLIRYVK